MQLIETVCAGGAMTDAPRVVEVAGKVPNAMLRVFAFIAIISLVITGLLYLFAGCNQNMIELAKKSTFFSIIGIIVGLGVMIILRMIIALLS